VVWRVYEIDIPERVEMVVEGTRHVFEVEVRATIKSDL